MVAVISDLRRIPAQRVVGIDASTNSLAFSIFDEGEPVGCGEIFFHGSTVFERLHDAKHKTRLLVESGLLRGDLIVIESAVMVRNIQTVIDLAYMFGAIIGELMVLNPRVQKVAPITWQSAIGNKNLTSAEKEAIKQAFPGKSKTWYSNKGREFRKSRTLAIARKYFRIDSGSDNVSDATGLARYAVENLIEKKEI